MQKLQKSAIENSLSLLHQSGLKITTQRRALLSVLLREESPRTVTQIASKIKNVNQITVYRALEVMVMKGLVRKIDTQHPYTHYELVATRKHHHHAICMICAKIEDVDLCLPKTFENNVLKSLKNFSSVSGHALEFIGTCTQCTNK